MKSDLNNAKELSQIIIGCCFDVMNELGIGFLEVVYKRALIIALRQKGLSVEVEKRFSLKFRGEEIGLYIADLIVENQILIELKCCDLLIGDHLAQLINYLKVSNILRGLLINFGLRKIEYKKALHPDYYEKM